MECILLHFWISLVSPLYRSWTLVLWQVNIRIMIKGEKTNKKKNNQQQTHTGTTSTHSSVCSFLWKKEGWRQRQDPGAKEEDSSILKMCFLDGLYCRGNIAFEDSRRAPGRTFQGEKKDWKRHVCIYICLLGIVESPYFFNLDIDTV